MSPHRAILPGNGFQNVYTTANVQEQGISIALALTELFIKEKQKGACRIHGGGFAGVIMVIFAKRTGR